MVEDITKVKKDEYHPELRIFSENKWDKWYIIQEDKEAKKHKKEQIAINFRREYEYWQRAREEHPWNTLDYV